MGSIPEVAVARHRATQDEIGEKLRRQIVSRQYPPGARLPTRSQMVHIYKASIVTVQRALDGLTSQGFVIPRGRSGSFVANHPPHLTHFGLVSLQTGPRHHWDRFYVALADEGAKMDAPPQRKVVHFHVNGPSDSEGRQRVIDAVCDHRVAGLVFTSPPNFFVGTPALEPGRVPAVCIAATPALGIPVVNLHAESFFSRALDHMVAAGRKRVAVILPHGHRHLAEPIAKLADARGLDTRPYWMQVLAHSHPECAQAVLHLLFHAGQGERPDGLIIANENFVEYASVGLVAAGVRVPDDVEVISHCNFPSPSRTVLPMRRLGYHPRDILSACFEAVERQVNGQSPQMVSDVVANFEETRG